MRSLATGNRNEPDGPGLKHRRMRGFTLIELIVVVSIVSALALALGLATGPLIERNRAGGAAQAAAKLEREIEAARAHAFHHRRTAGLMPQPRGWAILLRAADGEGWEPAGREGRLGDPVQWQISGAVHMPGGRPATEPPIRFLADGRATPFRVTFGARGAQLCETDGMEPFTCRAR